MRWPAARNLVGAERQRDVAIARELDGLTARLISVERGLDAMCASIARQPYIVRGAYAHAIEGERSAGG